MKKKVAPQEAGEVSEDGDAPKTAPSRGISKVDLVMRVVAAIATFGSAIAVGTTNQTLPLFTRFIRFKARYQDLPAFS